MKVKMRKIHVRRIVIITLCVVGLLALLVYSSAFPVVRDARRVMTLEGMTGTALDSYAHALRTEEGSWGKATIIPLAVVPRTWNTSLVWVWYDREVFGPEGDTLSYANSFAKWTIEREHGKWSVASIEERP